MDILTPESLPERIADVAALEELISRPTQAVVDDLGTLDGDLIVLGVGGKVGPCLARMARRAAPEKRVVGVARFNDPEVRKRLDSWGVETIACELLDRAAVEALPKLENVVYMAGRKFGTTGDEPFSWAMNVHAPGIVAEAFSHSRIVAFSTLCVYPYADVGMGGCDEETRPGPVGEYANSCVGRERILQYFSGLHGTPGRLIRLNYAIDLRYGVLFDVATWVRDGQAIDLDMGHVNVIWHGDVNAQVLRALRHCRVPAAPLNVGGPEITAIRALAHAFAERFDIEPVFENAEAGTAWVNRTDAATGLFGSPMVPLSRMIDWVADWVSRDMPRYDKPTRYQLRDGAF